MRVLHIDTGREMRGGQWQVAFLLEGLCRAGIECELLTPPHGELARRVSEQGIRVEAPTLGRIMKRSRHCDIVHAHTGRAHTLALAARGGRLVVARRVAFPVRRNALSRWKYQRPSRFTAVSEYVKKTLVAADVKAEKVSVVYDGVPELEPSRPSGRIIALASTDPGKGTALAREAAARAGLELQLVTDLREALRDAGLLVYLTEEEGLGSGALLAMSAGVPVLASRVGGLIEVVEDGNTGVLVENDASAVAAALRELMANRSGLEAMGRRARDRVAERFSVERMVEQTRKVYEETLA